MSRKLSKTHKGLLVIEGLLDGIFTPKYNPVYYLGAITIFLMGLVVITGVYMFIYYKIDLKLVYQSIQYLTEDQRYIGGIMRSIHRYASDGLIIAALLHLSRIFITGKYTAWRWLSWVSGIVLLITFWVIGILGYWIIWDQRAQLIAGMTAELLDYLPIFAEKFTRAFLSNDAVTFYMFFMIVIIHIGLPVLLFFIIWIHVCRNSRPVIKPPHIISIGILLVLLTLALLKPALSTPPADLNKIPAQIPIDWFYLFFFPIYTTTTPGSFWLISIAAALLLLSLPWLRRSKRLPKAEIMLRNCVGHGQCSLDCPYEAIYMRSRTDSRPFKREAAIIPQRCASCGICVASCTFTGVRLSKWTDGTLKKEISRILSIAPKKEDSVRIFGFVCANSAEMNGILDPETMALQDMPDVKIMTLPCSGMISPSMIEHAFGSGAEGVFTCGCRLGDCYYREGNKWLQARLSGERYPALKDSIDPSSIRSYWLSAVQTRRLLNEIRLFQEDLRVLKKKPPATGKTPILFPPPTEEMAKKSIIAKVNDSLCNACWDCCVACPYEAIDKLVIKNKEGKLLKATAKVNEDLCIGCGICVAACRSKSIDLKGYTDEQVYAAINAF